MTDTTTDTPDTPGPSFTDEVDAELRALVHRDNRITWYIIRSCSALVTAVTVYKFLAESKGGKLDTPEALTDALRAKLTTAGNALAEALADALYGIAVRHVVHRMVVETSREALDELTAKAKQQSGA